MNDTNGPESTALLVRLKSPRPLPHELLALLYVALGIVVLERLPVTYPRSAAVLVSSAPLAIVGGSAVAVVTVRRFLHRRRAGRSDPIPWSLEALIILRGVVCLLPLLSVHFLLKSFIHLLNARTWDVLLLAWDQTLFFGLDPGRFFTGLFFQSTFLKAIDLVYSVLYPVHIAAACTIFLSLLPPARRLAFLSAWSFLWIAGTVFYLSLPSWGPVFVTPDTFEPTLQHMPHTVSVQSVLYREIRSLVQHPLAPREVRYGCVAAFPSLHLAVVTLIALASRQLSRTWFVFNVLVVLLMLIGSVVTGYHYLLDGWAGILIGAAVWKAGLLLFRRWEVPEGS